MATSPDPVPPLSRAFLDALSRAAAPGHLLTSGAELTSYAWDNTGFRVRPQAVVLATTQEEVAAVLRCCHQAGVPVTPRGSGTGNVGGALAVHGGVVLSVQRLDRILEIRPEDRLAVVEPGVINTTLQEALHPHGLFWPPDPSSARICSVGGNLAMCAAGPNAVRYGVTRDWVLGLEAVLPDGTLLRTGSRTTKGVVGYDLTRLLVGSEGTLAVITKAILKLAPRPQAGRTLRLLFASVEEAARAVSRIMAVGEPPSAIEFLDPAALELLRRSGMEIPGAGRAMLLLEVTGATWEVERRSQEVAQRVADLSPLESVMAQDEAEARRVWDARFALGTILKKLAPRRINEDVVVPVSRLAELVAGLEEMAQQSGIPILSFGHAGNGNLHVNLLVDPADEAVMTGVEPLLERLFRLVLALGGTLSGEHGVGTQKRPFIAWELDPAALEVQRRIKAVFDPRGILNPGKVFP